MRTVWTLAGLISVGLGMIGAVLPLLPTVPFMLLAAFCFARGSRRFHDWLLAHPTFGPSIIAWREHGAITRSSKRFAVIAIVGAFVLSIAVGVRPEILALQAAVLTAVSVFILTRPDGPAQ